MRPRGGALNLFFDHGFIHRRWPWVRKRLSSADVDWPRFIDPTWMKWNLEHIPTMEQDKLIIWQCLMYELWLDRDFRHPTH